MEAMSVRAAVDEGQGRGRGGVLLSIGATGIFWFCNDHDTGCVLWGGGLVLYGGGSSSVSPLMPAIFTLAMQGYARSESSARDMPMRLDRAEALGRSMPRPPWARLVHASPIVLVACMRAVGRPSILATVWAKDVSCSHSFWNDFLPVVSCIRYSIADVAHHLTICLNCVILTPTLFTRASV